MAPIASAAPTKSCSTRCEGCRSKDGANWARRQLADVRDGITDISDAISRPRTRDRRDRDSHESDGAHDASDPATWTDAALRAYLASYNPLAVQATDVDKRLGQQAGRLWSCFHILLSVALLGELISTFDELRSTGAGFDRIVALRAARIHPR